MLLGRSVISPVRKLAAGLQRVRDGQHATRVEVDGAQELRTLAEGFNEMTATVAEQHRRLEHLAATDHLTGLANHRSFHDALGRALAFAEREGHSLALVALDLDHFKALNDAYGHAYGDRVLRSAAANLQESVRAGDLVGRVGGEEFALLLPGSDAEGAMEVAERARLAVEQVTIEDTQLGCSAGVAVFPDDTLAGPDLLAYADAALYAAKRAGRGRTHRFDARHVTTLSPKQQRKAAQELLAEPERLITVFQPIVSLSKGVGGGLRGADAIPGPLGPHPRGVVHPGPAVRARDRAAGACGVAGACGARPPGRHLSIAEPRSLGPRLRAARGRAAGRHARHRDRDHRAGADLRPCPAGNGAGAAARTRGADRAG